LSRWHTSLDGSSDQPSKMTVCGTVSLSFSAQMFD
jgi:hypothetical protein